MAKKPETKFKEKIYPQLLSLPKTWVKKIQLVGLNGIPDFIMCIRGYFVAIELKKHESEDARKLQIWNIDEITKAEGIAMVVSPENWNVAYEFLHTLAYDGLEKAKELHH